MKKVISIILSILFLGMSLLPCSDAATGCSGEHAAQETSARDSNHSSENTNQEHGHADHCSPFCVCLCCGIPLSIPENEDFQVQILTPFISHSFKFQSNYFFEYSILVWQPPANC